MSIFEDENILEIKVYSLNQSFKPDRWWAAEDYFEASKPLIKSSRTIRRADVISAQYRPNTLSVGMQLLRPLLMGAGGGVGVEVVAVLSTPFWRFKEPSFWLLTVLLPLLFGIFFVVLSAGGIAWRSVGYLSIVMKDGDHIEFLVTDRTWDTLAGVMRWWGCGVEEMSAGPASTATAGPSGQALK